MATIQFTTPTLLDIRAVTIMGLNAKPNSKSPIGYFGTGLKYAIATILRNHIPLTIWIGGHQYIFGVEAGDFRGVAYDYIYMYRKSLMGKLTRTRLPFTTQLGKDWELWQAFRELESNTRDEGGYTDQNDYEITGQTNTTAIRVGPSEDFTKEYYDRDKTFLPQASSKWERFSSVSNVEIWQHASPFLYYRGMRVMDLPKPSLLTYNILYPITLTEDRTAKYSWEVEHEVISALVKLTDKAKINHVFNAKGSDWESGLPFDQTTEQPSPEFLEIGKRRNMAMANRAYIPLAPRFSSYVTSHSGPPTVPLHKRFKTWVEADTSRFNKPEDIILQEVIEALETRGL